VKPLYTTCCFSEGRGGLLLKKREEEEKRSRGKKGRNTSDLSPPHRKKECFMPGESEKERKTSLRESIKKRGGVLGKEKKKSSSLREEKEKSFPLN